MSERDTVPAAGTIKPRSMVEPGKELEVREKGNPSLPWSFSPMLMDQYGAWMEVVRTGGGPPSLDLGWKERGWGRKRTVLLPCWNREFETGVLSQWEGRERLNP